MVAECGRAEPLTSPQPGIRAGKQGQSSCGKRLDIDTKATLL